MSGDEPLPEVNKALVEDAPRVVRLRMPPDFHRSTVSDHVACGRGLCDAQWSPDGTRLAFISSSRDHKDA